MEKKVIFTNKCSIGSPPIPPRATPPTFCMLEGDPFLQPSYMYILSVPLYSYISWLVMLLPILSVLLLSLSLWFYHALSYLYLSSLPSFILPSIPILLCVSCPIMSPYLLCLVLSLVLYTHSYHCLCAVYLSVSLASELLRTSIPFVTQ